MHCATTIFVAMYMACLIALKTSAAPIGRPASRSSMWDDAVNKYEPNDTTAASGGGQPIIPAFRNSDAGATLASSTTASLQTAPMGVPMVNVQSATSGFIPNDGTAARDPTAIIQSSAQTPLPDSTTTPASGTNDPQLASCYATYKSSMTILSTWTAAQVQQWLNGAEAGKNPALKNCVNLARSTPQQQTSVGGLVSPLQHTSQIAAQVQNVTQQQQQQQSSTNMQAVSKCYATYSTALSRASTWTNTQVQQWMQGAEAAANPDLKNCIIVVYPSKVGSSSATVISTSGLSTVDTGAASTPSRDSCKQYEATYDQLKVRSHDQIQAWFSSAQAAQNPPVAACLRYMLLLDGEIY